jgi:hypothetical protein
VDRDASLTSSAEPPRRTITYGEGLMTPLLLASLLTIGLALFAIYKLTP